MRRALFPIVALALVCGGRAVAQTEIDEEFNAGKLDLSRWCPCQIDNLNAPVTFHDDAGEANTHYAEISVNDFSLGGNKCRIAAPGYECGKPHTAVAAALFGGGPEPALLDLPEPLGPRFFGTLAVRPSTVPAEPGKDPYCTDEVELRAHRHHEEDECIERQELRLTAKWPSDEAHWYSFRFRMPDADSLGDRRTSIRWVIAQWKEEPLSRRYEKTFGPDWGPSPFLALRFDDGVLNVTVQDEDCRCLVASAPDPDGVSPVWTTGKADHCESAKAGDPPHLACSADLNVTYGNAPILPTALGNWVEMRFRVQATRDGRARIEVEDGGRPIVTVTGKVGYDYSERPDDPTVTKFKIGHYRDYLPFPATMDIDWLKVEDAKR
jgi:Polysaccharide lyase